MTSRTIINQAGSGTSLHSHGHLGLVREANERRASRALMPIERQICVDDRAIADGYWLHTPKFGTFDHFQRWRFAT